MRDSAILPPNPTVLEFGRSNWYGDVSTAELCASIKKFVPDPARQAQLQDQLHQLATNHPQDYEYHIATIFIETFLGTTAYTSIDVAAPLATHRFNLNLPVPLDEQFDITLNFGTAEHVFNVLQFFKSMHERTKPGGLMLHSTPFIGWPDHGFYSFQPTFFFDIARANQYEILLCVCAQINPWKWVQISDHDHFLELLANGQIPPKSIEFYLYRKPPVTQDFVIPAQRIYSRQADAKLASTWMKLR